MYNKSQIICKYNSLIAVMETFLNHTCIILLYMTCTYALILVKVRIASIS